MPDRSLNTSWLTRRSSTSRTSCGGSRRIRSA
jgi:hypothetical protein